MPLLAFSLRSGPRHFPPARSLLHQLSNGLLSSLVDVNPPPPSRLFPFLPEIKQTTAGSQHYLRCKRPVIKDGIQLGVADLLLSDKRGMRERAGPLQLCPYFEPLSRTLRFRKADGEDFPAHTCMADLLGHKGREPILHLALAEGLIDRVPGCYKASLSCMGMRLTSYRRIP